MCSSQKPEPQSCSVVYSNPSQENAFLNFIIHSLVARIKLRFLQGSWFLIVSKVHSLVHTQGPSPLRPPGGDRFGVWDLVKGFRVLWERL